MGVIALFAGVDTHKDSLAVGVIDQAGVVLATRQVHNTEAGFRQLSELLERHGVRRIGIEGSGAFGRAVAVHLAMLGALEVVEVPPLLTSRERSARPGQGKTDPIDAIAIARIAARETSLPPVRLTIGPAADLRALMDYRDQLVTERTQTANRVHAELAGLRPGYQHLIPSLSSPKRLRDVSELLHDDRSMRADLVRRRVARMTAIDTELAPLRKQITAAVDATGTSLRTIYGVGDLIAARILAEVVDVRRYPNRHAFASANGSAPIPASSGRTVRHRLNRGGNRRLNRCLFTIALTEVRADTEGRAYYARKRAEGKTNREAMRCLKRRLSDLVFNTLMHDARASQQQAEPITNPPAAA
jgi:transposase